MWSDEDQIAMGGGGDGFAFLLSKDFSYGTSAACETFNNEPLAVRNNKHHSNKPFTIINVEVWCFEEPKTFSPSSKNRKRNLI